MKGNFIVAEYGLDAAGISGVVGRGFGDAFDFEVHVGVNPSAAVTEDCVIGIEHFESMI